MNIEKKETNRKVLALSIYSVIFLIIIPYILHVNKHYLLMYYMMNVDIIANILTVVKTPNIFSNLYMLSPNEPIEYISQSFINFIVLMSMVWGMLIYNSKYGRNKTMLIAFVIIVTTYIMPTFVIPIFESHIRPKIIDFTDSETLQIIIEYGSALFVAMILIFIEYYISHKFILKEF